MELLELPRDQSELVHLVMRRGEVSLDDLSFELKKNQSEVGELLEDLVARGFLKSFQVEGERRYKIMIAKKSKRKLPMHFWGALDDKGE
ncbi:MAG: winged helix DNA-binding protein [Anaerolineales bacterium]|nr:winged helix DNA-binding protein [Anaerolineales bacterium]